MSICNQRGQGLIEYVLVVALIGAATIGLVTKLQGTIKVNLGNTIRALQGTGAGTHTHHQPLKASDLSHRDFSNFWHGAAEGHGSRAGGDED